MIEALFCVASAIYFEARGEPIEGQAAVAWVVHNRVNRKRPAPVREMTTVSALLEDMLTHSHADGKVVAPINRVRHDREYYVPVALQDNKEPR